MLSLVEDVLDISAIEAGKLKLHTPEFSVPELLDGIGAILQPMARNKRIESSRNMRPTCRIAWSATPATCARC